MADIFISYQRQERDAVQIVAEKLRALKFDVWFDEALRAGGSFDAEIASNLKAAKAVLVCWTPAAIASEWVRAEAAMAHNEGRLLAAFLEPTDLIPPFNLVHAENLMAWAGQEDDEAWLGLLARIGEMTARPGLTTYYRAMRPEATAAELRAWAQANGADPLAEHVWERIALIEGEDSAARIAREKAEARTRDLKRAENAARSKALAKARGLRDPKEQGRRLQRLTIGLVALIVLVGGAIAYSSYSNYVTALSASSLRELDRIEDVQGVRAFMARQKTGPVYDESLKKFYNFDVVDWAKTQADGSVQAYDKYLAAYSKAPQGKFIEAAGKAQAVAGQIAEAQRLLSRLRLYEGEANGSLDAKTYDAITLFQYRHGEVVTGEVSAALVGQLKQGVLDRIATPPDKIPPGRAGPPTEDDYRKLAARLKLDGPTLMAVRKVEFGGSGFAADGRLLILFEPHKFSRATKGEFDASNPRVSYHDWKPNAYPSKQADRWAQLSEAFALDHEAAYGAASYGVNQILASNYKAAGFVTASEFVQFMAESEVNQLEVWVRFCQSHGILDELQRHDWAGFARGYHGPGQVEKYSAWLRAAYVQAAANMGRTVVEAKPPPVAPEAPEVVVVDSKVDPSIEIPKLGEESALPVSLAFISLAAFGVAFAFSRRRA